MKYIVFDIDGVLADSSKREQQYLIGKEKEEIDWDLFYKDVEKDKPIHSGILTAVALIRLCTFGIFNHKVIFVTGRNDTVKHQTLKWLSNYLSIDKKDINIFMRPVGEHNSNSKFKESVGEKLGFKNIVLAFDDNKKTVDMWRNHGVKCFHTDDRDFKQNNY